MGKLLTHTHFCGTSWLHANCGWLLKFESCENSLLVQSHFGEEAHIFFVGLNQKQHTKNPLCDMV